MPNFGADKANAAADKSTAFGRWASRCPDDDSAARQAATVTHCPTHCDGVNGSGQPSNTFHDHHCVQQTIRFNPTYDNSPLNLFIFNGISSCSPPWRVETAARP